MTGLMAALLIRNWRMGSRTWACGIRRILLATNGSGPMDSIDSQVRCLGDSTNYITYRVMVPEDENTVKSQLYEGYFREEPISKSLNFDVPRECRHLVDALVGDTMKDNVSILAVDENNSGNLAGVLVCRLVTPQNDKMPVCSPDNPDTRKMFLKLSLWEKLHESVDLFKIFNAQLALHCVFGSVKTEYARRGILDKLLEFAGNEALKKGAVFMYGEASSNYSLRSAIKLGLKPIKRIPLDNYTDIDVGETIAGNTGDHKECVLVAAVIPETRE